jgi:hypothetical protein
MFFKFWFWGFLWKGGGDAAALMPLPPGGTPATMIAKSICDTKGTPVPLNITGVASYMTFGNYTLAGNLGNRHAFK